MADDITADIGQTITGYFDAWHIRAGGCGC